MLFISKCATFQFDAFIVKLICHKVEYNKTGDRPTGNIYNYTTNVHIITDHSGKKITNWPTRTVGSH
jgi:hypothetical protein